MLTESGVHIRHGSAGCAVAGIGLAHTGIRRWSPLSVNQLGNNQEPQHNCRRLARTCQQYILAQTFLMVCTTKMVSCLA